MRKGQNILLQRICQEVINYFHNDLGMPWRLRKYWTGQSR